jgi:CRISPR/Cas system-associated exonuclease Cas4 (RecB family)
MDEKQEEKKYLSFSQINMYLKCPRQYEYRYIKGIKKPPSGALVLGTVWHSTVEENYKQKIETKDDLPLDHMQDFFADSWEAKLEEEEIDFKSSPATLKDTGISVVGAHHTNIAPLVNPVLVEEKFRVSLGDNFPFDLLGFWDVIDDKGVVIDNKSYSKAKNQDDINKDLQLTAYSLAYRLVTGKIEKGLRIDSVIKNKKPRTVQISTTRTNEDCKWFLGLIEGVAQGIVKEVFPPNPLGWWCSSKWCGFWETCKFKN